MTIVTAKSSFNWRWLMIGGFFPLVVLVLGADSVWFSASEFQGQLGSDILAALFFLGLLIVLDAEERFMALVFLPFSALAEYLFSSVLEVYIYRLEIVPLYVPLGHAILFSTGLMLSKVKAIADEERLPSILMTLQGLILIGAIVGLKDFFSAVLALLFGLVVWWRSYRLIYSIMYFLVLYIELLGTVLECWTWQDYAFGIVPTTNPPFGAFVFYVFGDIAVLKVTRYLHSIFIYGVSARQNRNNTIYR